LHSFRHKRQSFSPHAEHICNQLLGHSQHVAIDAVEAEKQPSAQLLLDRVVTIAQRGLRRLGPHRLNVSQEQPLHGPAAVQLSPQRGRLPAQGRARALDRGPRERGIAAQDEP
jgi:hypothetical protein